ncbi:hypothetical protein B0H19DRAFT_1080512 [Mycena capillaripes]|nr:hypothetical protein B0H19DRAFT_1080512 [Mycena capillaripes]
MDYMGTNYLFQANQNLTTVYGLVIGHKLLNSRQDFCDRTDPGFRTHDHEAESLPHLREIAIPARMTPRKEKTAKKAVKAMEAKKSAKMKSKVDDEEFDGGKISETGQQHIDEARTVLRASAGSAPKRIKVSYWEDITAMVGMAEITYGQYWVRTEMFEVYICGFCFRRSAKSHWV